MSAVAPDPVLGEARHSARRLLEEACSAFERDGLPRPGIEGKTIRPIVALAGLSDGVVPAGFPFALAAIQLAHEASLIHDDIIDGAIERRGAQSAVARQGLAAALVQGDHLLTTAYRAAVRTGSERFMAAFAYAVERTVAGERAQGERAGRRIDAAAQRAILTGKSGELFACALAAGALLDGCTSAAHVTELGRRLGVLYQRVDDLLDYLPAAQTGKPSLQDYRSRIWTWPLDEMELTDFSLDVADVAARFREPDATGASPCQRALTRLDNEIAHLRSDLDAALPEPVILHALLAQWQDSAHAGADTAGSSVTLSAPSAPALTSDPVAVLARGSHTFRFAAHLFPAAQRQRIAAVYAFCRHTDDLVDGAQGSDIAEVARRLDSWERLARRAYDGERTGVSLVDAVMHDAARSRVSFACVAELIEGMRMDLNPREYATVADLMTYTRRVAGTVGVWLTGLHGVREPQVLARAAMMGNAMQLTNILRDVGEDLAMGRIYIPQSTLASHGLDRAMLLEMHTARWIHPRWPDLIEELMSVADAWYRDAFEAIPGLPRPFRQSVAVAAGVYQGIHDAIRRNGYDNLTRRARTRFPDKLRLGALALIALRRTARRVSAPPAVLSLPSGMARDG